MSNKQKKLLIIFIFINFSFFIYYCLLSDINPTNDTFYYMSISDSFYQGIGFYDVTSTIPNPIITPQNGIVFIHLLFHWLGLHDPGSRLLLIKIINYIGFLSLVLVFYRMFLELNVSSGITILSMGIILLSAYLLKTIIAPINDGFFCILISWIFFLIVSNETSKSFIKIALITILSIVLANFRVNGPLIILCASITYLLLKNVRNSLIYFIIFCISYGSIYAVLRILDVDLSGIKAVATGVYNNDFFVNQAMMVATYTLPGAFLGISGRPMLIAMPISIILISYYIIYAIRSIKEKSFVKIFIIIYIMLTLLFVLTIPWRESRYIMMIIPFTLLTIGTIFKDSKIFRFLLSMALCMTIAISLFRLYYWDSVYFINNKSLEYVQEKVEEPYILISQSPRLSYYIFNKRNNNVRDIKNEAGCIMIFGNEAYIQDNIKTIQKIIKVDQMERYPQEIIIGHSRDEIYNIVKIIAN